ncbi:T9SS type A sorting domain-containing protein, partial [bacterium]|nr:T9SS type A sorting domain-containing protein [bacterium]
EEGGISIKPEGMEIEVYPNPFNAILNIQIATVKTLHATSPQKALATVGVYDINGRLVFSPFNPMNRVVSPREQGQQPFPSRYGGMGESGSDEYRSQKGEFIWNPQNLPSGIYLIRVSDGEKAETKKVLYLK